MQENQIFLYGYRCGCVHRSMDRAKQGERRMKEIEKSLHFDRLKLEDYERIVTTFGDEGRLSQEEFKEIMGGLLIPKNAFTDVQYRKFLLFYQDPIIYSYETQTYSLNSLLKIGPLICKATPIQKSIYLWNLLNRNHTRTIPKRHLIPLFELYFAISGVIIPKIAQLEDAKNAWYNKAAKEESTELEKLTHTFEYDKKRIITDNIKLIEKDLDRQAFLYFFTTDLTGNKFLSREEIRNFLKNWALTTKKLEPGPSRNTVAGTSNGSYYNKSAESLAGRNSQGDNLSGSGGRNSVRLSMMKGAQMIIEGEMERQSNVHGGSVPDELLDLREKLDKDQWEKEEKRIAEVEKLLNFDHLTIDNFQRLVTLNGTRSGITESEFEQVMTDQLIPPGSLNSKTQNIFNMLYHNPLLFTTQSQAFKFENLLKIGPLICRGSASIKARYIWPLLPKTKDDTVKKGELISLLEIYFKFVGVIIPKITQTYEAEVRNNKWIKWKLPTPLDSIWKIYLSRRKELIINCLQEINGREIDHNDFMTLFASDCLEPTEDIFSRSGIREQIRQGKYLEHGGTETGSISSGRAGSVKLYRPSAGVRQVSLGSEGSRSPDSRPNRYFSSTSHQLQ